jgi:two-component system cell cycle sensor histidine kinase/response regulator CckA
MWARGAAGSARESHSRGQGFESPRVHQIAVFLHNADPHNAHGIVKQVKGHVAIESKPGMGTTVTIVIPATDEKLPAKPQTTPSRQERATGTVLVVDDYGDLRELMEEILKNAGYRVLSASNGAAALALAKEHPGEIDVLLTDIVMPSMLGPDLAEQMKLANPNLRVLFMSGYALPAQAGLGTSGLDTPLLQKPFMGPELLDKMREVLATGSEKSAAPALLPQEPKR